MGPDPLTVLLQAGVEGGNGTRINGTRIIDQRGHPLTSDALFPPRPLRVDGVVDGLMRGELVVLLDTDAMGLTGTTRLSGIMSSVTEGGTGFILELDPSDQDNKNAVPSGSDQSVTVPPDTRILLVKVNMTDSTSESLTREQLVGAEDQYINLYAVKPVDGLGEWIADTILVIIPGSPSP